jgi:glycosyltransferase involved in cell wall biosynthesis
MIFRPDGGNVIESTPLGCQGWRAALRFMRQCVSSINVERYFMPSKMPLCRYRSRSDKVANIGVAPPSPLEAAPNAIQKVCLIGPVQPFRGGVAQYTTQLHRALTGRADLLTLSFKRQYPAWLFPGQSERDPEYAGYMEPGVQYLIDPYRPDSWWRAVERIRQYGVEQVIISWWTTYWFLCFGAIARRLRRYGIRVTFLCHNVQDHEGFWFNTWAAWLALRQGDDYLVHAEQQRAQMTLLYGNLPIQVHPHPIYSHFPNACGALPRRALLELLFYGFVRPYKGVDILLKALAAIPDRGIFLTIAGEIWGGGMNLDAEVRAMGLGDRVEIRAHYHSEQKTAQLFARADAVVLPYRHASASGVLALAYHYNKPVVVTRVGGLPDMVAEGLSGFVVPPADPQALAVAIEACRGFKPCPKILAQLKQRLSWDSLAESLIAVPMRP